MIDFLKTAGGKETTPHPGGNVSIVPAKPPDLETAKKPFRKYTQKIADMKKKATALVIKDETTDKEATEMLAQIATIQKAMKLKKKGVSERSDIAPALKVVAGVKALVLSFSKPLDIITKSLKSRKGTYSYQVELKRRADVKKAQDAQTKLQAKLDKQAEKEEVKPVTMPAMVVPKKPEPVRTETGSSSTRYQWTYEITDWSKVKREHLEAIGKAAEKMAPDEKNHPVLNKVFKPMVDAGIRKVAGVRIYEKPIVSVRGA